MAPSVHFQGEMVTDPPGQGVWLEPFAGLDGQAGAQPLVPKVGSVITLPVGAGVSEVCAVGAGAERVLSSEAWASATFGAVLLGDRRRNERAVRMAARMAAMPGASLPQQMLGSTAELKAAYCLLHRDEASLAALSRPHWEQTRRMAAALPRVLLVEDFTTLDLNAYGKTMRGVGRVGSGNKGFGMFVHTTLMVEPGQKQALGVAHQQVLERLPVGEADRDQRPKEERLSRAWPQSLEAIGPVPEGTHWMLVADREADFMELMLSCRRLAYDFCIRVWHNRPLVGEEPRVGDREGGGRTDRLLSVARSLAPVVGKVVHIPGHNGRKARDAKLQVSYGEADLQVPEGEAPLHVWIVRAWEVDAPAEVKEPLEWILCTTQPVRSAEEALQILDTYACRWVIEEYHQCLKTGCGIEERDFEEVDYLEHLLGFLGPLAVRLLQLRDCARRDPQQPAAAVADELTVKVLAARLGIAAVGMSARGFWRNVARLGGFLGRKRDGEPGWKSLWRGWLQLETLVAGARIALTTAGCREHPMAWR